MSAPVFVVERAALTDTPVVWVQGPEGHHAADVMRLRLGEPVDLTDGEGLRVHGRVAAVERSRVGVDVVERAEEPPPSPRLVVVQALPKGDRGERAVEMLTEVGVDEIVPWSAERCVTVWRGERGDRALTRWRTTARAAAKQSRRWWHPEVAELAGTASVVARLRSAEQALVLHEAGAAALGEARVATSGEVVLVVGPEGGLSDGEVAAFEEAGAGVVRLGPTVLRTSTAGVVAAGLVLSRSGRWRAGAG